MTSIFKFNVKSTHEPSTTGTLNAKPSSFPSKLGSTLPTADAAPVYVGIILFTAALPLLLVMPFLCEPSRMFWSFVKAWIVDIKPDSIPK